MSPRYSQTVRQREGGGKRELAREREGEKEGGRACAVAACMHICAAAAYIHICIHTCQLWSTGSVGPGAQGQ